MSRPAAGRVLLLSLFLLAPQRGEVVVSRLFAGTDAGLFVSYSWGEHWQDLSPRLPHPVRSFACLGPQAFAGGPEGLFVSEDWGESWRSLRGWEGGAITHLLASSYFALDPVVFAGTTRGLYRSSDGGREWERVGAGLLDGAVSDLSWPGPDLFVAASSGVYRSKDGGERFDRLEGGLPSAPILSLAVSRYFAADPVLFAGSDGQGLYRTTDGGKSFVRVGGAGWSDRTVYDLFWWGASLFAATDSGLFVSEDAGESWRSAASELEGKPVYTILVPAAETGGHSDLIVGTDRGVYKSPDGAITWRHLTEGMGELRVQAFGSFPFPRQTPGRRRR